MKLHVAFLTSEYPYQGSARGGGIATSTRNLARELHRQGVTVSVFVYSQHESNILNEDGIKIHLLKSEPNAFMGFYRYRKFIQNYVNKYIADDRIDIIEAPDWTGITAFMKLNAPLIIRFHGSDAYFCKLENRRQKLKNFIFEWLALRSANAFVSPSQFAADLTSQVFQLTLPVEVIPNGISLDEFHNSEPELYQEGLIVYVGTLIRKKGVFELPPMMAELRILNPDAKLILVGTDGADIATGSKSTWELIKDEFPADSAEYIGKVDPQMVSSFIKRAHVLVFPTFAETLGMVTIEAMAMQKPVVTSDFGWTREIIQNGISGILTDPTDHKMFARCVADLLQDRPLCRRIGQNAVDRVANKFEITKIAIQNIDLYRKYSRR